MRRRALLSSIACSVSLAGCLSSDGGETTAPVSTPTETAQQSTTPDADPSVLEPTGSERTTLSGTPFDALAVDTLPDSVSFEFDAEMVAQPAAGNPGRLRISVTNTATRTLRLRTAPNGLPFPPTGDDDSNGPTLVVSNAETFERDDDCARGPLRVEPASDTRELPPDASLRDDRYLYTYRDSANCYPPGEYDFSRQYTVLSGDTKTTQFRWGFTLSNTQ